MLRPRCSRCGGSLAAVARETAPNSNRKFERQHAVGFPILNDATGAVARSFGIGWTEAYLQSLYDQFVADRTGDPPEPSWIEPMQARYVIAQDGTITYVDISADYRVAPELTATLEVDGLGTVADKRARGDRHGSGTYQERRI
jgi:peroxiredoxin